MPIELGYPLPARKEYFEQQKPHSTWKHRVSFMESVLDLPVIRIPVGMPKYRLANGRTASMQQEYLAKNPSLPADFFSKDTESDDAQGAQHSLLKQLMKNAGLFEYFRAPRQKQEQPIILDENGFVINGNRRLCAWRELFNEDAESYKHFEYIDAVVLPPATAKAIDELEAKLQVVQDIKDDYEWHSFAIMVKSRLDNKEFDLKSVSSLYEMKEKDIQLLLDALDYANAYLKKRGMEHQWSQVSDKEHSFKRIVENRSGLDVGAKKLFEEMSFVLIDNPEGGRVYEDIRLAKKHFEKVREDLQREFKVTPVAPAQLGLELLGGGAPPSIDMPLAAEVEKDANHERVREIVREAIASQEQLGRDMASSSFLLKCLQKANSSIVAAKNSGLKPESVRTGVREQIEQIESNLTEIKRWLGPDA